MKALRKAHLLLIVIICVIALSLTLTFLLTIRREEGFTEPVKSYVQTVYGNAKLFINGEPVDILAFYTTTEVKEYIDKAARYGVLFCNVRVGWIQVDKVSAQFFRENPELSAKFREMAGEGRLREVLELLPEFELPNDASSLIDFQVIDEILDYAARREVYIVLSFCYLKPPIWWLKNFPDQIQMNSTGGLCHMATFNSPALIKYADQVIRALVSRYKNHPALLGWGLCFGWTSEDNYPGGNYYASWGIYDYSPMAVKRFRDWLRKSYNDNVTAFRLAWRNETVTFDDAVPPKPLPPPKDAEELVEFINGPGDTRRAWLDWMLFRLEEKTKCMLHFANLYKALDPNHVIIQTPATPLSAGLSNPTFLSIDYYSYAKSPIDVVYVNPGLDDKTATIVKLYNCYPPFLKYYEQHGKAAFIKWEGRPNVNYDQHPDYIEAVAEMARKTGTGLAIWGGHVPMPASGEEQPEFTDSQIQLFINTFRSTPEGKLEKSKIVILEDPRLCFFTYYKPHPLKLIETTTLWIILHLAGIDCDVLPIQEVKENLTILQSYKAVILDNMYRIDEETTTILQNYLKNGGWLILIGKTATYNWQGEGKFENLKKLLGINTTITEAKITQYSWTYTNASDPLLNGIAGQPGDIKSPYNLLYIPTFNYEEEGYTILGTLNENPNIATVLRKNKIIVWFPRLGLQLLDRNPTELQTTIQFLKNLYNLINTNK